MISTIVAVFMLASCGTIVVGPEKPLTFSVTLADVGGNPCNDHLQSVKLLRAESPIATVAEMIEVAEMPAPSPTGFDEDGHPHIVRFVDLPQGSMVEGTAYYFFSVLTDAVDNESPLSAPSEETFVDRTPPSAVGSAPVAE